MPAVVFLDFDGVLNSERFVANNPAAAEPSAWWTAASLDPSAVAHLNRLVTDGDAEVVVTSTWRKRIAPDELQRLLESVGFVGRVVDVTPTLWRSDDGARLERGDEVRAWLSAHPRSTAS